MILVISSNHVFSLFQCVESLVRINSALANTANKRERVKILHKKSEQRQIFRYTVKDPINLLRYICLFTFFYYTSWRSAEVYRSTVHRLHCCARCNETGVYLSRSVVFFLSNQSLMMCYCFSGNSTQIIWWMLCRLCSSELSLVLLFVPPPSSLIYNELINNSSW